MTKSATFLDNVAHRQLATLVHSTTKQDKKWHNVVYSDEFRFFVQYSNGCTLWASIKAIRVFAIDNNIASLTIEYTTWTYLVQRDGKLTEIRVRLIS